MDPFTKGMLERARARREKLDSKLVNAGHQRQQKIPFQDSSNTRTLSVTAEVEVDITDCGDNTLTDIKTSSSDNSFSSENVELEKENVCENDYREIGEHEQSHNIGIRDDVKSRLQRLGALYSDKTISSPINRTEIYFNAEEDSELPPKPEKSTSRMTRLAALADSINQWEDDLGHPKNNQKEGINVKSNEKFYVKTSPKPKTDKTFTPPKKSNFNRKEVPDKQTNVLKQVVWDKAVLETLDEHVISPSKRPSITKIQQGNLANVKGKFEDRVIDHSSKGSQIQDSGKSTVTGKVDVTVVSKISVGNSPCKRQAKSPASPQRSVLHTAAIFEAASPPKKPMKDPAELSVAERLALFEKNKGQALIPKAPFSMSVPSKYLDNKCSPSKANSEDKSRENSAKNEPQSTGGVSSLGQNLMNARRKIFENSGNNSEVSSVTSSQIERQKEMELLSNRWNRNKEISKGPDNSDLRNTNQHNSSPPKPPPLPKAAPISEDKVIPCVTSVQPKIKTAEVQKDQLKLQLKNSVSNSKSQYPVLKDVKKIKVSPPKPGHLYPCLSDLEATTETESEVPADDEGDDDMSSSDGSSDMGNSSFGREILHAAGLNNVLNQQNKDKYPSESDMSDSDNSNLDDILDEVVENDSSDSDNEGPTPPKRSKEFLSPKKSRTSSSEESPTVHSQSFKYSRSPQRAVPEVLPSQVVDGEKEVPLLHTVSFYRKQQNMAIKSTPVRRVIHQPDSCRDLSEEEELLNEELEVRKKISSLFDEVAKQQTVMSQASQALNLCSATVEFSGSTEQVEGERLLLLATHKRQAALHEIQRLKIEATLRPKSNDISTKSGNCQMGSLTVSQIFLPLKKEYLSNLDSDDTCYHFVCFLRSHEQVIASPVLSATRENLKNGSSLAFCVPLKLKELYSDFKATIEVYSLKTRKEILPHNVKYHIGNKKDSKLKLTPKKLLKQESKLVMPTVQSPAGPSAVRSPSFQLAGYVVFSLREVNRTQFTLNKVAYGSPLDGNIHFSMTSELSLDITERGFLTMFKAISGFGAWHRRWCCLKGQSLSFWKYPDDENKKEAIESLDLRTCITENVGLVARDVCARPNTFLLEITRPCRPDDENSYVLECRDEYTIERYFLSADSKEDRMTWCSQLNKTLSMLKVWSSSSQH